MSSTQSSSRIGSPAQTQALARLGQARDIPEGSHDEATRHAQEFPERSGQAFVVQVVQQSARDDHIEGPIAKGESTRIGHQTATAMNVRAELKHRSRHIDSDEIHRQLAESVVQASGSRRNVEQAARRVRPVEAFDQSRGESQVAIRMTSGEAFVRVALRNARVLPTCLGRSGVGCALHRHGV